MSSSKNLPTSRTHRALETIVSNALKCSPDNPRHGYAAVETLLTPTRLPSQETSHFMGFVGNESSVCSVNNDPILSTLMVVLHSLKDIDLVVFLVDEHSIQHDVFLDVTQRSLKTCMCMVATINGSGIEGVRTTLSTLDHRDPIPTEEGILLSTIAECTRSTRHVIWYWSGAGLGYAPILSSGPKSRWIYRVSAEPYPTVTPTMQPPRDTNGAKITRIIPFFYRSGVNTAALIMGIGGLDVGSLADLRVGAQALCNSTISRVYNTVVSSGRCFCCQYIVNLQQSQSPAGYGGGAQTLPLEPRFVQRMSKDDRHGRSGDSRGS